MKNKDRPEVQKIYREYESYLKKLGRGNNEVLTDWLDAEYTLFTSLEKEFLSHIDSEYKWIARDSNSCLYAYSRKPHKIFSFLYGGQWKADESDFQYLPLNNIFKSIKWEDEEPVCIDNYVKREETKDDN